MARIEWAHRQTGLRQRIGYLVPKGLFQNPGRFLYTGVGGVPLPALPEAERREVLTRLHEAEFISVRDRTTRDTLASQGIQADLVPDPAVLTAEVFGPLIKTHQENSEPRAVRERFPQGYVAVQFSADFGVDAELQDLAGQLDALTEDTGHGIVLFRAGAAPWHDDLNVYRRLLGFIHSPQVRLFESLQLWDICGLLAGARAYCGSSLHGRIVAEAFGVPGIHLLRAGQGQGKLAAYASTWSPEALAAIVGTDDAAQRLQAIDAGQVRDSQVRQVRLARQTAAAWLAAFKD
jgi:polysaccharide pyruvyl transferase WcaK-like protein